MQEAKRSKLQFSNPKITEFTFKNSSQYDERKYKGYGIRYDTKIFNRENTSADVSLRVSIGVDENTVPFLLEAVVMASFRWDDGIEDSLVDSLLNMNAKLLLLSYLRPFVAHMTIDAGYPPLVLPFMDFSEEN